MAKEKAIYAPGELSRVRDKLGSLDDQEAKRMAKLLGGEVGVEKNPETKAPPRPIARKPRQEKVEVVVGASRGSTGLPRGSSGGGSAPADEDGGKGRRGSSGGGSDNPNSPVRASYWERVKMDRLAGQQEFDIKSPGQVLVSMLSFFSPPADMVSYTFVTKRLGEYYKRLETLVTTTRILLPRSNIQRIETLKKKAPFVYSVLETIRLWNIDTIAGDMAKIQARPRAAMVSHFADILKNIYRPLYLLEQLDTEQHIKGAFKVLYKLLYLEDPVEAKDKYQELIRSALVAYAAIRRDIHYMLFPLLQKLLSDRCLSYESFFKERKNRFLAFIEADEDARIALPQDNSGLDDNIDLREDAREEEPQEEAAGDDEDENDPAVIARKAEKKAVTRGLETLETLFPKAGWDRITEFPDLYPYFGKMFDLTRGYEQISPLDPLHQMVALARILEELFFGLRYVSFAVDAPGFDDSDGGLSEVLTELINNWHSYLEASYYKEYLPRVREYARILEGAAESRNSTYAKKLLNELHWAKRLFFFPYYKFESLYPPSIQKKDIVSLYPEIRKVRRYLTAVASGIEQGMKQGGADKKAPCPGINNPWSPYEFQVPNPLSQRLDVLLSGKTKNNASLIFFTLAVATVLDYLVNNEGSWAYAEDRPPPLFRGIGDPGSAGLADEDHVDADALFHESVKKQNLSPGAEDDFVPEPLPEDEPQAETAQNSGPTPPEKEKPAEAPVDDTALPDFSGAEDTPAG